MPDREAWSTDGQPATARLGVSELGEGLAQNVSLALIQPLEPFSHRSPSSLCEHALDLVREEQRGEVLRVVPGEAS